MRLILALAAGAALAMGSALAAQSYLNPKYGYRMSFPDGWLVAADSQDPGAVAAIGGDQTANLRLCLVGVTPSGMAAGTTQSEVDAQMTAPFGQAFWIATVGKSLKNPKVESSAARVHPSRLRAQEALVSYSLNETGDMRHVMKLSVMVTPEVTYSLGCNAASAVFGKFETELQAVLDSFRHKPGIEAGVNPAQIAQPVVKVSAPVEVKGALETAIAQTADRLKAGLK